jgi:acyl-CoA thioester hydrolase
MATDCPTFTWPIRVYYEDTDAGGIVYNANYLRYMERARTEWLRTLGMTHGALSEQDSTQLVITRADLRFRAPARLDDELQVTVTITRLRRASLDLLQEVRHGPDRLLCSALVTVACVDTERHRPQPLPSILRGVTV